MSSKLRIAWFSPRSNEAGISAYVTKQLLPHLRDRFDIEFFQSGFENEPGFKTFHYLSAFEQHRANPYDIFFYQIENSRRTFFSKMHLGLIPGITLFHNYILSEDGPEPIMNSSWEETVQKYSDYSRPWPDRAREYKKKSALAYREAALAAVPVFSNPWHRREYQRSINCQLRLSNQQPVPAYFLPVPAECSAQQGSLASNRICYCGSPRIEARAHKLLLALAGLKQQAELHWLIDESERNEAEELLREFSIKGTVLHYGRTPENWKALVNSCAAALHPLFSVYEILSPYLEISLAAGVPVVVTRFGPTEDLPDTTVFKIDPGETEAAELRSVLDYILVNKPVTEGLQFAAEFHDPRVIAAELGNIFVREAPYLASISELWCSLEQDARQTLLGEVSHSADCGVAKAGQKATEAQFSESALWKSCLAESFTELGWE